MAEAEFADLSAVGDSAGAESADVPDAVEAANADILASDPTAELTTATSTELDAANEKVQNVLDTMGESLGMDGTITDATLDDASGDNPKTSDGEKLKSFWESFKSSFSDAIESEKETNGETGKDIEDSPKTQQSLYDKYGKFVLTIALIGGALWGALELNKLADALTGCYQIQTCASQPGVPIKVQCSQVNCNCSASTGTPGGTSPCATPACGGTNCVNYYWQHYTPLQALATLPGVIAGGLLAPVTPIIGSVQKLLVYAAIFIGVLLIAYVAYKIVNRETILPKMKFYKYD